MSEKNKVVTDSPKITGYMHGSNFEPRRETSDPNQQQDYEKGYRQGAKDTYKIRFGDET